MSKCWLSPRSPRSIRKSLFVLIPTYLLYTYERRAQSTYRKRESKNRSKMQLKEYSPRPGSGTAIWWSGARFWAQSASARLGASAWCCSRCCGPLGQLGPATKRSLCVTSCHWRWTQSCWWPAGPVPAVAWSAASDCCRWEGSTLVASAALPAGSRRRCRDSGGSRE